MLPQQPSRPHDLRECPLNSHKPAAARHARRARHCIERAGAWWVNACRSHNLARDRDLLQM
jgi:hypothetical protein